MAEKVDIKAIFDLPPERAIAFLDSKGYRTSIDWTDTFNEEHDASFTVAKIAKVDLLRTIHISLLEAQTNGQPFEAWLQDLKPALADAGWWGKVEDAEITGTEKTVFVGPRRLRTIYDTNLRMARSAALWERIVASKDDLPFLRYSAVLDGRTRPLHRQWHNTILPVEHPWWQTHFPPCGWNCRCTVVQYSRAMLDRRRLTVTEAPPSTPVPFFNKSTRQRIEVPRGIDPGFGYNPGIARMQAVAQKVAASLVQARGEGLPIDDAALADILADLPPGSVTPAALTNLQALVAASNVAQVAAALLELMGVSLATAATKRRRGHAGSGLSAAGRESLRRHADERRGPGGRFKPGPTQDEVADFMALTVREPSNNRGRLTLGYTRAAAHPEIDGLRIALKSDSLRHILRRHGTGSKDRHPISAADLLAIPRRVNAATKLKPSAPTERGNPTWEADYIGSGFRHRIVLERIRNRRMDGLVPLSVLKRPI